MPSQTPTPTPLAYPIPRRRCPLLTASSNFNNQDLTLCLSSTLDTKAKLPYMFVNRMENDYAPPAPPPPSPVNFPMESWSTACGIRR